jgi:hypothetical protein
VADFHEPVTARVELGGYGAEPRGMRVEIVGCAAEVGLVVIVGRGFTERYVSLVDSDVRIEAYRNISSTALC